MKKLCMLLLCLLPSVVFAEADPEELIRNMKPAWKKINDFTAEMTKREAFGGKLSEQETIAIKFSKPFRVYLKYLSKPYKNREAIYQGKDWNSGKIKANNGSFPNVVLNLDVYGSLALKDQHHPITHIGYEFSVKNAIYNLDLAQKNGDVTLKVTGRKKYDGRDCTNVEASFNPKAGQNVTPTDKDTWWTLANKYGVDAYVLQHNNPKKKPNNAKETIWVPTYYASVITLCIDDAIGLPIYSASTDHAGKPYEEYGFSKLKVNVGLTDMDFNPDNAAYEF